MKSLFMQAMAMTTLKLRKELSQKTSLEDVATTRLDGEEEMIQLVVRIKYLAAWAMISLDLQP